MYIPNPSCKDFSRYEWIGQLMGAALRSKEFLVSKAEPPCPVRGFGRGHCISGRWAAFKLRRDMEEDICLCFLCQILSLPALVWKQLAKEEVNWSKDFASVDLQLVSKAGGQ